MIIKIVTNQIPVLCWQFIDQWVNVINEGTTEISTGHTIIDNKVSFPIYSKTRNTWKTLGISIIITVNSQVVKKKLQLEKSCNLISQ